MKFNFAKTLLMSSVLAMGAFGLVACGDDGPSKGNTPVDSSIIIKNQEALDMFGSIVKFNGSITTDNEAASQDADFAIDSLKFQVLDSKGNVTKVAVTPASYQLPPHSDKIDISEVDPTVNLDDPNFKACGAFKLNVIVSAHLDKEKKTSSVQIPFNRDAAQFCPEAPASSSGSATPTGIEMVPYEVTMSTDMLPGLDLATGTASASTTADLVISKASSGSSNKGVIISSGNGTLFSAISNEQSTPNNFDDDYEVDYWPEVENGHAYVSDFMFKFISKEQITDAVEAGSPSVNIYVAKTVTGDPATGVGFFAFAIIDAKPGMNGDFTLKLKVYKKK